MILSSASVLKDFPISEILLCIVGVLVLIKWIIEYFDWGHKRTKDKYDQESERKKNIEDINEKLNQNSEDIKMLIEMQKQQNEKIEQQNLRIELLIDSDKDDIKAFITEKYHYFVEVKGWIDDYSLDCLERRFQHYKDENGNSFVADLMSEIKRLPKHPPQK